MTIEWEGWNVTTPLKNTTGLKCIYVISAGPSSQAVDLSTVFGSLGTGHYLTLAADGAKVYVAFGANAQTIDDAASGGGNSVCWPIPDGQQFAFRMLGGNERATGYATLANYNVLHAKCAAGASGFLRIYRSSVGPMQDASEFKIP